MKSGGNSGECIGSNRKAEMRCAFDQSILYAHMNSETPITLNGGQGYMHLNIPG